MSITEPEETAVDIASWLRSLGLERYEAAFRENDVDAELLPNLTADDLKEISITSLGHRRRLLEAIAALRLEGMSAGDPIRLPSSPTGNVGPPETAAERRPLSVMFCDLIGSTALSSRLDPEDLREVIGTYQACVATTIQQFHGFIARYVGDGVLIYFGWPEARETDAERAVRAGLAVATAVSRVAVGGELLQVRIGVATGLVVIGEPIGSGDSRQQTAVGETPNLAARLQGLAGPGQVVIDAATRRQIGGLFECQDLGTVELKGLPAAVSAWQVLSENRMLGQFEALRSGSTPLVGRNEETELLFRRWAQVKTGSGRVVLISAEPGVGKSRLVAALAERIAAEPHTRLRYFCSPHHQDSALYPVVTQMERAAGFARGDTPVARLNKLQMFLAPTALPKEDEALIADLHSLPSADLAPPLDVTPQRRKQKMFEALLRQAERLSREQPVLMEFEDVHWIDFSSREYLNRTVEWIVNLPVLLLVTFRPEFQPQWTGQPHVTMLALSRLDRSDAATLVESITGSHKLPPETVQEIAERTDGVPLFIEELTKAVLEAGRQEITTRPSKLRPAKSIPATLHASLMARLDRLGPAAKRIAQIGAALGRVFSYDVLLAVAPPQSEQGLRETLERLVAAQLLSQIGAPPDALYSFKHALVQDAAYANLLRGKRRELHGHIAAILEKAFPETAETQPDLIAHHCTLGGLARRAVHWWRAAGRQAIRRSANVEAVAHLKRALELISFETAGPERDLLELEVRVELGGPLIGTKGWGTPELAENYTRAWALCETTEVTPHVFPVLWGLFTTAAYRVESGLVEAQEIAERFLHLAQQRGEIGLEVIGHRILGVILVSLGQLVLGRGHLERAIALYGHECLELEDTYGIQPRISALANLCLALQYLGHLDQASRIANQALEEARRLGQFNTLGVVLHLTGRLRAFRREGQLVRELASELIALSRQHGSPGWELVGEILLGWGESSEGGLPRMRQGVEGLRAAGSNVWLPAYLLLLAEVESRKGAQDEALRLLDEAEALIEAQGQPVCEPEIHRLRATVLLERGEADSLVEAGYTRALSSARGQSARFWELRAAISLACLWRKQGKIADALAVLAPIYGWFTEGFDSPDLVEAKLLLDDMETVAKAL